MPKDPYALLRALLRAEAARDARAHQSPEPAPTRKRSAQGPQKRSGS
ncbi:hypothetical protein ABT127_16145 [Streptomyces sp. NPDC001904]